MDSENQAWSAIAGRCHVVRSFREKKPHRIVAVPSGPPDRCRFSHARGKL